MISVNTYKCSFELSKHALLLQMSMVFLSIAASITFKVVVRHVWDCPAAERAHQDLPNCATHDDHPILCLIMGTIFPSAMMAVSVMLWGQVSPIQRLPPSKKQFAILFCQVYAKIAQKLTKWGTKSDAFSFRLIALTYCSF